MNLKRFSYDFVLNLNSNSFFYQGRSLCNIDLLRLNYETEQASEEGQRNCWSTNGQPWGSVRDQDEKEP